MKTIDSQNLCGLKVSIFSKKDLEQYIDLIAYNNLLQPIVFYGYSIGTFLPMKNQPDLCEIINSFDVVGTDGKWFGTICKLFHVPIQELISIPNMVLITLHKLNTLKRKDVSVYLLGSTNSNNNDALLALRTTYSNITFYGRNGYYNSTEEIEIIHEINSIKPTLLLIGLPTPSKEKFAEKYKKILLIDIIIPCGGMINVFAGKEKLTPPILKKLGLAWLIRFAQNPQNRFKSTFCGFKLITVLMTNFIQNRFDKNKISIPEIVNKHYSRGNK